MDLLTVNTEEVRLIHNALVADFANSKDPIAPPGVRDEHLLESAVSRQLAGHDNTLQYPRPFDNAATLLYGLCCNHPFHNGNKRTALVAMLVHLDKNKLTLFDTNQDDLYDLMIDVANHTVGLRVDKHSRSSQPQRRPQDEEIATIGGWIHERASRLTRGEKIITFRELKRILNGHGYVLENPHGNSIDIVRYDKVEKRFLFSKKVVTVRTHIGNMSWPGENPQVSISEIKRVRRMCNLCEENGVDSEAFYNYTVVVDTFVNHYRRTLRRLAHA